MGLEQFRTESTNSSSSPSGTGVPSPDVIKKDGVSKFISDSLNKDASGIEIEDSTEALTIYEYDALSGDERIRYYMNLRENVDGLSSGGRARIRSGVKKFHVYCDHQDVIMLDADLDDFQEWLDKRGHTLNTINNYVRASNKYLRYLNKIYDEEYERDKFDGQSGKQEDEVVNILKDLCKSEYNKEVVTTEHTSSSMRNIKSLTRMDVYVLDTELAFECKHKDSSAIQAKGLGQALDYAYHGHISYLAVEENPYNNSEKYSMLVDKVESLPIGLVEVDKEERDITVVVQPTHCEGVKDWIDDDIKEINW